MGGLAGLILILSITLTSQADQYLLPITKDETTKQFYTTLDIGSTTISPVNLLLDLGTNLTWLNCHNLTSLSSLHDIACDSLACEAIPGNGCDEKSCLYRQPNPLGQQNPDVTGRVVQDNATFSTTDGGKFLNQVTLQPFTFSCAGDNDLQGLAPPIAGVLSLSPGSSSFTKQVTSGFNVIPKLALCLPSSGTGRLYVSGDHYFIPPFDNSTNQIPMNLTPMSIDSGDYLITVQSIYVDRAPLTLNSNLLLGGVRAKLSTVVPYTVLHTDIYNALAQSLTLKAMELGISKVSSVGPFKDCFESGPYMPMIEFGMPGGTGEAWVFFRDNTVVKVTETVMCLAFYDGGKEPKEMIVFGTHQLQDHMLEFDFSRKIFSFSLTLVLARTSCSTWPFQK